MADRVIHDADAHLLEPPDLFTEHADPDVRDRIDELTVGFRINDDGTDENEIVEHFRRRHGDPEFRSHDEEQIWLRKNFEATGSFIAEDRPAALDMLGVASQLIFNTFTNKTLQRVEHGDDLDLAFGLGELGEVSGCEVLQGRLSPVGIFQCTDTRLVQSPGHFHTYPCVLPVEQRQHPLIEYALENYFLVSHMN